MAPNEEVENRYLITEEVAKDLGELVEVAGFERRERKVRDIIDFYLDTEGRLLCKTGALYRLRDQNGILIVGFKLRKSRQRATNTSEEIEVPISPDHRNLFLTQGLHIQPYERAKEHVGQQTLVPTVVINNTRSISLFGAAEGNIEMAIDRVAYDGPGGRAQELELECEKKCVSPDGFLRFTEHLERHYGLVGTLENKYERAIRLVGTKKG